MLVTIQFDIDIIMVFGTFRGGGAIHGKILMDYE